MENYFQFNVQKISFLCPCPVENLTCTALSICILSNLHIMLILLFIGLKNVCCSSQDIFRIKLHFGLLVENFLSAELAKDNSITNCTLVFKHRIYKFTNSTFALPVKATGGGLRAQNHVVLIWTISLNCERCWRPHQKILFLAQVIFLKIVICL